MRAFQILVLALFVFVSSFQTANAQRGKSRIGAIKTIKNIKSNTTAKKTFVLTGLTISELESKFKAYTKRGYRLVFIDGYTHNIAVSVDTYFNVIFEENKPNVKSAAFFGLSSKAYQAKFNQYTQAGFRLSFIESYDFYGETHYAPIFTKESGPAWKAMHGISQAAYQQKFNNLTAQGYRLVNRIVVKRADKKYVTALFDKANVGDWVAKSNLSMAETQTMMDQQNEAGKKVAFMDVTQEDIGEVTFSPIFDKAPHTAWYALADLTSAQLKTENLKARNNGYKTIMVRGYDKIKLINGKATLLQLYAAAWVK